MDFAIAKRFFGNDRIRELANSEEGMRFLKLRSISRKNLMEYFIEKYSIKVSTTNSRAWLEILYNSPVTIEEIDETIEELYEDERAVRLENEASLISELYKIQSFDWGGLHQNSLEKTIVNNYVKKITSYNGLSDAIENDIHKSMRAYVLASWYNHWSSILIEDIFKDHRNVIPAVGLIKKIDFFVANKPFDLKVTYLPEGFIKDYRKSQSLRPELTLLKQVARQLDIAFEKSSSPSVLLPDLWRKIDDHPSSIAQELISELQSYREKILNESMQNPEVLIRWLYENQGVRRFDASNRLFLVLVDKSNFFDSWKLKRAKPLISANVNSFLDGVGSDIGTQLDFQWENEIYSTESDIVFVVK